MESSAQAAVAATVEAAIADQGGRAEALIEILHAVQAEHGCIPREAVPPLAESLNLSRAEIQGVIDFYHDFRTEPSGRTVIQVCRAEACQAMGVQALEDHVRERLGIGYHETTSDGHFSLEPVYCLGNCACAPSIRIEDRVFARVSPDRFDAILSSGDES